MAGEDFKKIGRYGAIAAAIEVVFGSIIKSLRVPVGGYVLSFVQNYLLILFGKNLENKNRICWISFITAAFKSLSPSGGKFAQMFAIFMQGLMFQIPIILFGWNFFSVTLASIVLGLWTIIHDLLMQYIKYGANIIAVYLAISHLLENKLGLSVDNQISVLLAIVSLRVFIAIVIAALGYYMNFGFVAAGSADKERDETLSGGQDLKSMQTMKVFGVSISLTKESWRNNLKLSTRDIIRPIFLFPLGVMVVLCIFAEIDLFDIYVMIVRFVAISWLFLVIARWIDFHGIVEGLKKRGFTNCAMAFESAFVQFPKEINRYTSRFEKWLK